MADTETDLITLDQFLAVFAEDLRRDAVHTLAEACKLGLGHWQRPDPVSGPDGLMRRPATHLHEITLLGVNASGDTPEAAAKNWLIVAHRLQSAATEGVAA